MRGRRRTPAGGVQAEKQQRFVRLIAQGVNNSEACRLVGINRKTGTRWRYGRTVVNSAGELVHYPPVKIIEPKPRSPRYCPSRSGSRSPTCSPAARPSARSRASWDARRRRSAARSAATATLTGATDRIMPSTPPRPRRVRPRPRRLAIDARAGRGRRAAAGAALEPGAGRARAAGPVRRSAVAVAVHGVDLSGDL